MENKESICISWNRDFKEVEDPYPNAAKSDLGGIATPARQFIAPTVERYHIRYPKEITGGHSRAMFIRTAASSNAKPAYGVLVITCFHF